MTHRALSVRHAEDLAAIFKMLSNANRMRILLFLASGEKSVSDIEKSLKIHQPTLSQQLGGLRDAELIVGRRVAKSALYTLNGGRGRRAVRTIHMLDGQAPPCVDTTAENALRRAFSPPAALFATIIPAPMPGTDAWRVGFNSLLEE